MVRRPVIYHPCLPSTPSSSPASTSSTGPLERVRVLSFTPCLSHLLCLATPLHALHHSFVNVIYLCCLRVGVHVCFALLCTCSLRLSCRLSRELSLPPGPSVVFVGSEAVYCNVSLSLFVCTSYLNNVITSSSSLLPRLISSSLCMPNTVRAASR
jgi:hypothetical protein